MSSSQTLPAPQLSETKPALINGYEPKWWKEAVVYQIYPRSFQDSNGDGIGDLPGITSRLDYLQKLGVNVLWLSPHYDSPNADNGYDIRDYRKVMAEFGTMEDFDEMLAAIKERRMRLIIDLVVNHTSDEHHWFEESRKSRNNPYRDFYIWRDGKVGADGAVQPPNNYPSFFYGSAWQFDPLTEQYYLHIFTMKQPDLNWEHPKVRQEVHSLMRFWLDKGVDGFRMDMIPLISKRTGLPDLTPDEFPRLHLVYANGPHMHEYLKEMNREVLSQYDVMTVGEAFGISLEETPQLVGENAHELNMIFNFDAVRINRQGRAIVPWQLPKLKEIYARHAQILGKGDWDTVFLSNHDNPRLVSTFGNDSPEFRAHSTKLLLTMLLTLRGTPFLYQGDELGMTNYPFREISDYDDIEAINGYKAAVESGRETEEQYLSQLAKASRDNARTPMQWDGAENAGFSMGAKTWLPVHPNYKQVNASQQAADPNSIYNYTRRMIALRAAHPAFFYGDYKDLDPQHPHIFAYTRTLGPEIFLVVLNFSSQPINYTLPSSIRSGKLQLGNYESAEDDSTTLQLRGWEARVYR